MNESDERDRFASELKCFVRSLSYDFEARKGSLHMNPDGSCDMKGCIALFTRIDPEVRSIDTYADAVLDTSFSLHPSGWVATHEGVQYK